MCVCVCARVHVCLSSYLVIIHKWSIIERGQSDEWPFELTVLWEANAIIVLQVSI